MFHYRRDKVMKVDKEMIKVLATMELLVGMQCYNRKMEDPMLGNSSGRMLGREGLQYRYPVCYYKTKQNLGNQKLIKTNNSLENIDPECFDTARYIMGTNSLHIGYGLLRVMDYLEARYDLDFNELEQMRIDKKEIRSDIDLY